MESRPDRAIDQGSTVEGRSHGTDERPPGSTADRDTEPAVVDRGSGIMWSGIAVILLMALLVLIAFQNTQDVTFELLWFDASIPLILILAITFGIAVVTTESVGFVWRHRRRARRRERDELNRLRGRQR